MIHELHDQNAKPSIGPDRPAEPSRRDVLAVLGPHLFERDTPRSLRYAASSALLTAIPVVLAWSFLPLSWAWAPVWLLYAIVTGTLAVGAWVIAHECGHGAFSENSLVQDGVGFVFHTLLLVPYFSWQRSHAVHHANTNHVTEGETHMPARIDTALGRRVVGNRRRLGRRGYAVASIGLHLLIGWPLYLLLGVGGARTNHFWPWRPFTNNLFPARYTRRVALSTVAVLGFLAVLMWWAVATSPATVLALYVGPYLINNAWLVGYTWLHHTGADTPHYGEGDWTYLRGAFSSIDRPYGRLIDRLHHNIGSTHAAHHLAPRIPHYHAAEATAAIRAAFPDMYRFDPDPIARALWRVGTECVAVEKTSDGWRYTDGMSLTKTT